MLLSAHEPFYVKKFIVSQRRSVFYAVTQPDKNIYVVERDGENIVILKVLRMVEPKPDRQISFESIDDAEQGLEGILVRGPAGCGVFAWDSTNGSSEENLQCDQKLSDYLVRRRQCQLDNGEWRPQGIYRYGGCVRKTRDGGTTCSDNSDCEIACLYRGPLPLADQMVTGFCAYSDSRFGCFRQLRNGRVAAGVCVD